MKSFRQAAASFALLIVAFSARADWSGVDKNVKRSKTQEEAVSQLKNSEHGKDEAIIDFIDAFESAKDKAAKDSSFKNLSQFVSANALTEKFSLNKDAEATAKKIKQDPIYKSQREAVSSNWIQKLWDRIWNGMKDNTNSSNGPNLPAIPSWVGVIVEGLFYLVCAAILGALIFLIIKIPWAWTAAGRARKAKRGGILEDGESLLSEDEYLLEAGRLIKEGRFREACRALYLASLLRIDKARIARFEPAETNWEHLRRIESSKTKPESFEFRPATKAFDLAWYGYRAKSEDDVEIFRETYLSIKHLTEGMT
jgi:hypothetical protein